MRPGILIAHGIAKHLVSTSTFSVYYSERKPKNKNRGGLGTRLKKVTLGDKFSINAAIIFQAINVTVTMDNWNIVYLSLSTGDPQTTVLMLRLMHPGVS